MGLRDKQQQRARALKMLESRIMKGKSNTEIAKDFNVSPATVQKAMSLAKKGDLLISFEDKLHNELLPLAHSALVGALADGNAKVALEIYKGTNILKRTHVPTALEQQDHDDLAAYILSKRTAALLEETSIDVTPRLTHLDAAAAAGPDAPGDSDADGPGEGPAGGPESGGADGPSLHGVAEDPAPTA